MGTANTTLKPITTAVAKHLVFTRHLRLPPNAIYENPRVATIAQELDKLQTATDRLHAELQAM